MSGVTGGCPASFVITHCFIKPTKDATIKSSEVFAFGYTSRKPLRDRELKPSLARRYRAMYRLGCDGSIRARTGVWATRCHLYCFWSGPMKSQDWRASCWVPDAMPPCTTLPSSEECTPSPVPFRRRCGDGGVGSDNLYCNSQRSSRKWFASSSVSARGCIRPTVVFLLVL